MVGECACRLEVNFENLAVCASPTTPNAPSHVYSSAWDTAVKQPACEPWADPQPVPSKDWSRYVDVRSVCAGEGRLCIVLKAGDAKAVSADDCELTRHCADISYPAADVTTSLGPLPSWVGSMACAARYEQLGGYLELNVASAQLGCGANETLRLAICPSRCSDNPLGQGCETCGSGPVTSTF